MEEQSELRRPAPPLSWRERFESIADATGVTPARLLLGGALAAAAAVAALWLLRPPSDPVEVALPFASTTAPSLTTTTVDAPAQLVVHVAGAVVAPGVHEVPADGRVVDAIDAAGGLAPGADSARINLAAPVADGERVYVPVVGEEPPPAVVGGPGATGPSGGAAGAGTGPVNLNTADEAALDALPGVGPSTAAAIIAHREDIGAFTSVEQLIDVRGIGEAKLEQLRPLVTV